MELTFTILGAIFASFFLFYYFKPKTAPSESPPEVSGAWPFTGHLHLMSGSPELPHIILGALSSTYGPAFTIRLGVRRVLVVSSWELAKHLFTTHDAVISSRPVLRAARYYSRDFAAFGFAPNGPYWRRIRRIISTELLSARRVEMHRNICASETAWSVNSLFRAWEERGDGSERALLDMSRWLAELNLNVVMRLVAGKRFSGGGGDGEELRWCQRVIRSFFELAGMFVVGDALPYLGWLDIGGHEKRMRKNARDLEKLVGGWLTEHREKECSGSDDYEPRDFMDVMMSIFREGGFQSDQYDDDTIIKGTCEALLIGGSDTTTVMLIWALSLLVNNRHALKKAQEEVDEQVGKERRVEESDIENLVYLKAVIKETLRLYPAGPLLGTREFSEDCNVDGYHVSKGTWLMVNAWKVHRDPTVWGRDAQEFKPERFFGEHGKMDVKGRDFELIPFSAGRRICPGMNFGLQMMHLVLADLLHAFDISTVSGEEVDMKGTPGMTNIKANPLHLLLAPRLSPTLYV